MADLSLLLDIVLKTNSQTIKKEFVVCGILNQLHQVGMLAQSVCLNTVRLPLNPRHHRHHRHHSPTTAIRSLSLLLHPRLSGAT